MNVEACSLLVVDDEELNREGLARRLRRHGYEVALAKSGREAAAQLAAANERMRRDLEAAARVQQAFRPAAAPEVPGARLAWRSRPCGELAGDALNVWRLDDRHLGLYVLDVNGHGIAAALLSL